jgi:hypothetical protein
VERELRFPQVPGFGADYWLCRCQGFTVEASGRRVGLVDAVRFGTRLDRPDVLLARGGLLGRRLLSDSTGPPESGGRRPRASVGSRSTGSFGKRSRRWSEPLTRLPRPLRDPAPNSSAPQSRVTSSRRREAGRRLRARPGSAAPARPRIRAQGRRRRVPAKHRGALALSLLLALMLIVVLITAGEPLWLTLLACAGLVLALEIALSR